MAHELVFYAALGCDLDVCYQEDSICALNKLGPFFIQGIFYCVLILIAGVH